MLDEELRTLCSLQLRPDDDESWLNVSPDQVDMLLTEQQKEFDEFDRKEASQRKRKKSPKQQGSSIATEKEKESQVQPDAK